MGLFADGLYTYQGSDTPEASSDGRPSDNNFYDNIISNTETGVRIKEADDTVITGDEKNMMNKRRNTMVPPFLLAACQSTRTADCEASRSYPERYASEGYNNSEV